MLKSGKKQNYWTDATDNETEGKWRWSCGETGGIFPWREGEPNNNDHGLYGKENFGCLKNDSDNLGKMNDSSNFSSYDYGFIVEIDDVGIEPTKTVTYKNNRYQLFDKTMPWKDAKTYCESLGGHLVTITSSEEQAAIETLVKQGAGEGYHIGFTDEAKEGDWEWVTGEISSYKNWCAEDNEPANTYGYQNYAIIYHTESNSHKWHDIENYRSEFGFICEFEGAITPGTTTPTSLNPGADSLIYGDIDENGVTNISDAVLLARYLSGSVKLSEQAIKNADCDKGSKSVNVLDVTAIIKFIFGDIESLPVY